MDLCYDTGDQLLVPAKRGGGGGETDKVGNSNVDPVVTITSESEAVILGEEARPAADDTCSPLIVGWGGGAATCRVKRGGGGRRKGTVKKGGEMTDKKAPFRHYHHLPDTPLTDTDTDTDTDTHTRTHTAAGPSPAGFTPLPSSGESSWRSPPTTVHN